MEGQTKMKPIPIVMVIANKRPALENQAVETLHMNTEYPYELHCWLSLEPYPADVKVRNAGIASIKEDWDYMVYTDDDQFFSKGWLTEMVKAKEQNPDVWVIYTSKWPSYKKLEKRPRITITDRMTGSCLLISKYVWEKCGPFPENENKTNEFRERVQSLGGKVAVMNDSELVVHCGIKSIINKKGRSKQTEDMMRKLADKVGAICE